MVNFGTGMHGFTGTPPYWRSFPSQKKQKIVDLYHVKTYDYFLDLVQFEQTRRKQAFSNQQHNRQYFHCWWAWLWGNWFLCFNCDR